MTEKELHGIFSGNLKEYRDYYDLSQAALAKKAGVSINFINDLESGKKWASPATMIKLAAVLKIEVYELLKPPGIFPDNLESIIKLYTDNIHSSLEEVHLAFLQNSKTAK
jgi:transcriptional regulator with XRE-family HTH domain